MTQAPRFHRYTYAEYVELEQSSPVRHEFFEGEIYALAGGTPEHAALAVTVSSALLVALRGGPCRVHSSDLRVRSLATGLTTYPDVTVVCGPYERDAESATTVTNPKLVVEITSDATEDYDRGEKLASYQRIPSLDAIVIVSHRERLVELYERQADGEFRRTQARAGERLVIAAPACELDIDAIYETVEPR